MLKKRFYTSNYETERPLPIRRSKKRINERWIRWKFYDIIFRILTETVFLLIRYGSEDKKAKRTKKWVVKQRLKKSSDD